MRRYETIVIFDPELSAEEREPVLERVKDVIAQQDGYLAFIDDWGARKLAYEIKKKDRGYYVRFDFCETGTVVDEIERFFRIDDRVLKYMTVLLDKKADIEKIKEEVAAAESKATEEVAAAESKATEEVAAAESKAIVPEELAEPAETQTPEKQTKPSETEPHEDQAEPSEIETPEQQTQLSETQPAEPEVNEADTTSTETEEETKSNGAQRS